MNKVLYRLKMFSSTLNCQPEFIIEGMDNILKIEGYDDEDLLEKVKIEFDSVLCYKKTSARFIHDLYNAYDKVVEVNESDWLRELEIINKQDYDYWKPRHFALFLDGYGMYEFIASDIRIIEYE